MSDANSDDGDFELRELSDVELAFEYIEQISMLAEYRGFLEEIEEEGHFRLKHRDDIEFSDICALSSAFLIREDEDRQTRRVNDWTTTDRCSWLIQAVPEDVNLSDDEVDALLVGGRDVLDLPPSETEWQSSGLDEVDLNARTLGKLRRAGLIKTTSQPTGHAWTWSATERLDEIRLLLEGLVNA